MPEEEVVATRPTSATVPADNKRRFQKEARAKAAHEPEKSLC